MQHPVFNFFKKNSLLIDLQFNFTEHQQNCILRDIKKASENIHNSLTTLDLNWMKIHSSSPENLIFKSVAYNEEMWKNGKWQVVDNASCSSDDMMRLCCGWFHFYSLLPVLFSHFSNIFFFCAFCIHKWWEFSQCKNLHLGKLLTLKAKREWQKVEIFFC